MRKIIIGFSTPVKGNIASNLIKLYEKSEYSHIYIKMKASPNSPLPFDKIFQASHGDVNAMTFERFYNNNIILHEYTIEVDDDKYFEIYNWLWNQLGKGYGFLQLLSIATKIKFSNNGSDKYICSELAAMVLLHVGYDIKKEQDYIGLNDLKAILDKEI